MDNPKNDEYYLTRIVTDMHFIVKHIKDITKDDFNQNEVLQDSMMFRLIQVSENAKKLSDQYRNSNSDIPWVDIFGLRNRIVHEYGHVDLSIIFEMLVYDIPEVLQKLERV